MFSLSSEPDGFFTTVNGEQVPILDLNPLFSLSHPAYKLRVIFHCLINVINSKGKINEFIEFVNELLKDPERIKNFGIEMMRLTSDLEIQGGFQSKHDNLISMPVPSSLPKNQALLALQGTNAQGLPHATPLFLVRGLDFQQLDDILASRNISEANTVCLRITTDLQNYPEQVLSPPRSQRARLMVPEESDTDSEFDIYGNPVVSEDSDSHLSQPQPLTQREIRQLFPENEPSLEAGPILSEDDVERLRDTPLEDDELRSIMTVFGFKDLNEAYEEIKELAAEVMRHNDQTYDEAYDSGTVEAFMAVAPAALRFAHRFILKFWNDRTEFDFIRVEELTNLVGYQVGSGALTFATLLVIYLIWRTLVLDQNQRFVFPKDKFTIRFRYHSLDVKDPNQKWQEPLDVDMFPDFIENNDISSAKTMLIMTLRDLFSKVHQAIQRGLGAVKEYFYHGAGEDKNAIRFQKMTVRLLDIIVLGTAPKAKPLQRTRTDDDDDDDLLTPAKQPRGGYISLFYPKYIMGSNCFWEWYFTADTQRSRFYREDATQAIMMPDKDLDGNKLTGCLIRALKCTCPVGTLYCRCHDSENYQTVHIDNVKDICKNLPVLVVVINIYPKDLHKTKDVQVLYCDPTYISHPDARVIIINNPNYRTANGHCCLFRPPDLTELRSDYQRFVDRSFFNRFLHKATRTDFNVCPVCGKMYPKKILKSHFKYHYTPLSCLECGMAFDSAEALDTHRMYHCKKLGFGCSLDFAREIKTYKDKSSEKPRAVIYADLESAISEDGTHKTILCGFCERDEKKVYIYETIWNLFTYAAKRPEDEVIVYFHNGEGYDFHFVLLELGKISTDYVKKIEVTADSSEKIRYFTVEFKPPQYATKKIHFRDSFAFVQQSLATWVESTKASGYDFPCFKETFRDPKKRELVLQKNPFPYNAIKSQEDLSHGIEEMDFWFCQPNNVELFCDKYTKEELDDLYKNWYLPAKRLFRWSTIDSYYRTYLKCDVSQLCDVMEHFADQVKQEFEGLDIHNYYGTPSLTWAAWLRQNKYQLDAVKEEDYDIINGSIRGGQTGAMTRYYDCISRNEDKGSFCCDLDCNSLYPTVMLYFEYPCHDWQTEKRHIPVAELERYLIELHERGRSGFIECDFEVPEDPRLYSYVPVASRRTISGCYNYKTMQDYAEGTGENPCHFVFQGLCNVLGKHEHYCCHTELMLFYIKHRFVDVSKVYKIIHAKNEPVFRDYVAHNLEQRSLHKKDPIKNLLYKLMNNSLYGKTYEDVTNRMNMEVVRKDKMDTVEESDIKRTILQLDKWTIFEKYVREFTIDKPVYLGAAITEYSKLWMYRFFYEDIRSKFPDAKVMYTDTDALTIKFPTGVSSFNELADKLNTPERQIIDTSNWPDLESLPEVHKKHNTQAGLFKSETGKARILRMVALRAKTYIMECEDGTTKMSVKGCPMKEKSKLTFLDFYQVMMGNGIQKVIEYDAIVSKFHIVKSTKLTRVVLSADDRKRYIDDDRIHTYPLFSKEHKDALGKPSLASVSLIESP